VTISLLENKFPDRNRQVYTSAAFIPNKNQAMPYTVLMGTKHQHMQNLADQIDLSLPNPKPILLIDNLIVPNHSEYNRLTTALCWYEGIIGMTVVPDTDQRLWYRLYYPLSEGADSH
jgi:hypothetical protein